MNCMKREDFKKTELFHIIDDIEHMGNEGRRYKAMFVLWDVIQRMKRNELTALSLKTEKSPIGEIQMLIHGKIN